MSDENVVVAGRVVEQTDNSGPGEGPGVNENRQAAIEAVKKAVGRATEASLPKKDKEADASKDEPKETSKPDEGDSEEDVTDGHGDGSSERSEKPKAKPEKKEEADDDKDTVSLKRVLKQKEKLARQKQEASENYRREAEQLQQRAQQLQAYERHIKEQAAKYERLRTNPVEAIKEFGWEPEQLVYDLANHGTPEGRQAAQLRQMQEQLRQQKEWQDNQLQAQQHQLRQQQEHQKQQYRNHIEQRFLGRAMSADKPYTDMFYKGNEAALIARGDILAAQARHLSGYEATPEEIADFIEEELAERANVVYESVSKTRKVSVKEDEEGSPESVEIEEAKPKAKKVGKTLGSGSNERRALSKKIEDQDDDERRESAKAAVKLILSKQRKAEDD